MHTFVVLAYKNSPYLEACIKSVLYQKYKSKVVIATSTPNTYISSLANKYNLKVKENKSLNRGIGNDFNFAISASDTELVTVAHQDDIYDYDYSYNIVERYKKNKSSLIIFTDYHEIKNDANIYKNINLRIKRVLLLPLKLNIFLDARFMKRLVIRFGNAICCPAVTFNKKVLGSMNVFSSEFICNVDWNAWEKLSKEKGKFVFIDKCLMGHRVHEESTTTEIIGGNIRTKEDLLMFQKFWPSFISKFINRIYVKSEKNNRVN